LIGGLQFRVQVGGVIITDFRESSTISEEMPEPPSQELRRQALERLTPETSSVVVIDMQYDFVDPASTIAAEAAADAVDGAARLLTLARASDVPVVHVVTLHRPGRADYGRQLEIEPTHCIEGTRGAQIVEPLTPAELEPVVAKRRYDGFFETDLRLVLAGIAIENLLFAGVCTELCVAATAHHAKSLDYRVFFVRDCLAGLTPERHEAGLRCFEPYVGYVIELSDVVSRFGTPVDRAVPARR
jgi:biuret amidohydrolase